MSSQFELATENVNVEASGANIHTKPKNQKASANFSSSPVNQSRWHLTKYETTEEYRELRFYIGNAMQIFEPVVFLMVAIVIIKRNFECFNKTPLLNTLFNLDESSSTEEILTQTMIISGIFLVLIISSTILMSYLFLNSYDKIISGYMYFVILAVSSILSSNIFSLVADELNWPVDYFTLAVLTLNYTCVAGLSILTGKAPLIMQQVCLLTNVCMLILYVGNYLPRSVAWIMMLLIVGWELVLNVPKHILYVPADLIAVLPEWGPLRKLIESADKRDKQIMPAMLYSSTMAWFYPRRQRFSQSGGNNGNNNCNSNANSNLNISRIEENVANKKNEDYESQGGMQLGMGDFIFYGIFIGLTCNNDSVISLACIMAIVYGLAITLTLMVFLDISVPALPISICFGLLTYVLMYYCVNPMLNEMQYILIFI